MYKRIFRMYTYQIKEFSYVNQRRKAAIKYGVTAALTFIVFITSFIPNFLISGSRNQITSRPTRFPTDLKYILFWTSSKEKKFLEYNPGQKSFVNHKCPVMNCYVSYNKRLLGNDTRNFDAVVFDIAEIVKYRMQPLNFSRSPHQVYVLHSLEPASKVTLCNPELNDFFNWTWTYKLNSDIPHPFFNVHNLKNEIIGPKINVTWLANLTHDSSYEKIINNKREAVAWIVSHCKSKIKHQKFIQKFQSELEGYNYTLDIYGACGHKSCTGKSRFKCYKMMEQDYFFSLVTEETTSEDWVTERIVNTLNHIAIPIVIGGANYSSFLPPGSYIDAKTLSIKELGAVINYLIQNPYTYSFFFDWKNHYYYTPRSRSYFCDLCTALNKNYTQKSYNDIRRWWNPQFKKRCKNEFMNLFFNSYPDYGND